MKITQLVVAILCSVSLTVATASELEDSFQNPPDNARPGVYWYFMDGNQNRDEMVADLHAMKDVGIGSVLFLEVNIGVPTGPVNFMSAQWQDNIVHAVKTTQELGMEFILGTGPGWSGSGGSWVKPEDSMQHLVGSSTKVQGPAKFEKSLPVAPPQPPNRFAGMNGAHTATRNKWFRDVAVLAFPTPKGEIARFDNYDIKTLKDVRPYSIDKKAPTFVMPQANYPEPDAAKVIDANRVIDLTSKMKPDGTLRWDVPKGDWTIMRFVARSTGQTTRPAPRAGHGFECDKFNADAYRRHWDSFQGKLLKKLGPLTPGKGLTTIHLDSWEMSSQNWSAAFRDEFTKRRGYDPQPFYPAYMGMLVGSHEKTERFLWDMRKTSQELVLENHADAIKKIAHKHGLRYSNEPYDMNPAGNIDLGSIADIPGCEFWNAAKGPDTQYSCIEAVSIAHTMGKPQVNAEAFTTAGMKYLNYPGNMKNQTDWAFAMGINGIIFHTFQHQPLGNDAKPGMTMGPYGVQWHRNRTMWHLFPAYHQYIARCSHLLRQGAAVADILYLTPEGAPHIFIAPESALAGSARLKDKKGYNFDAVTSRILKMRAKVEDGKIAFPEGSRYSVLVLPNVETMTPETLATITKLVQAGATVIGNPPRKSPSLTGFPGCDKQVQKLAGKLWSKSLVAQSQIGKVGQGRVILNTAITAIKDRVKTDAPKTAGLYPEYEVTAAILDEMGIPEDFESNAPIRYGHRRTDTEEIYFIANTADKKVQATCTFRVEQGVPQLWDPVTAKTRTLPKFTRQDKTTSLSVDFDPHQSFFVIFPHTDPSKAPAPSNNVNFAKALPIQTLNGSWTVSFDPKWGGPENIVFDKLQDWTHRTERGIKYYSGSATYRKTFDAPGISEKRVYLDLGTVHDMARVTLNGNDLGVVWCAPWRVNITSTLKTKGNLLEVEIVNRWPNRLLGDKQAPDKNVRTLKWKSGLLSGKEFKTGRYTFSTTGVSEKLLPSGLLGPVRIMVFEND